MDKDESVSNHDDSKTTEEQTQKDGKSQQGGKSVADGNSSNLLNNSTAAFLESIVPVNDDKLQWESGMHSSIMNENSKTFRVSLYFIELYCN